MNKAGKYTTITVAGVATGLIGGVVAMRVWGEYLRIVGHFYFTVPMGLAASATICALLGVGTGVVVCFDGAKLPRSKAAAGYTLVATLALFAYAYGLLADIGLGRTMRAKFVDFVPLLIWSLILELRAVYLIRRLQP